MKKSPRGFSLIELSVVILIIGIFVAGALSSSALVKKFRISTARSLTQSSPVNSISSLSMWLETSLEKSFSDSESNEGSTLSSWYDVSSTSVTKTNASQNGSNKPIFSSNFNNINAVKFDGTSNFLNFDGSLLNNSDYTIFITEKRESNKSSNYFIGDSSLTTANQNLILGYSLDGQITHSQGTGTEYSSNVSTFATSSAEARIFTFLHSSSLGKKTYINGILAGESPSNTTPLSNITTLTLGILQTGSVLS